MSMANGPQPGPFARSRTSGLAVASLVLSCIAFLIWPLGLPLAIAGIVCGHLARREIRNNPGLDGDGLALAGLIVGYIFLAFLVLMILVLIPLFLFVFLSAPRPISPPPIHIHELNSAASLFLAGWL